MNSLIQVVNKLQDVFRTVDNMDNAIQLPQIAVVGTQSAGKSSVIESIVGFSFLPRGTGIITRRPLVLQLIRCPMDDTKYRSKDRGTITLPGWGEFHHRKDEIFTDFNEIRKEIENDTDRVAGENKGICDEPINLKIYSTELVDLTVVDLPGLTKVPIGAQPKDIERQIKNLIFKYIKNVNCIILVVTAANVDIATSEALKFAKEVDPNGSRTLAVLTKIDLMDEGTDAIDVLSGDALPVKLGIVGVVNRSQQDIIQNKSIEEQLTKEAEFFKEKYPDFVGRSGTPYLATTLSNLLIRHIRKNIPGLQERVNLKISENRELLKQYGDGPIIDKHYTILRIITKFADAFKKTMAGTVRNVESACNTQLYRIIHKDFPLTLSKIKPVVDETLAKDLLFKHSPGPRPHLFDVPAFDAPFKQLVRMHIEKLLKPSLDLVQHVRKEIKRNFQNYDTEMAVEWKRFPKLKTKIFDLMTTLVSSRIDIANKMVEVLIKSELAYINTEHPDFQREKAIAPLVNRKVVPYRPPGTEYDVKDQELAGVLLSGSKNEKTNCEVLQNLVELYFEIVRKTVADTVPKAIMFCIVNVVVEEVNDKLVEYVCKTEEFETLLDEANEISQKRERSKTMLTALTNASKIIDEVKEGDYYDE